MIIPRHRDSIINTMVTPRHRDSTINIMVIPRHRDSIINIMVIPRHRDLMVTLPHRNIMVTPLHRYIMVTPLHRYIMVTPRHRNTITIVIQQEPHMLKTHSMVTLRHPNILNMRPVLKTQVLFLIRHQKPLNGLSWENSDSIKGLLRLPANVLPTKKTWVWAHIHNLNPNNFRVLKIFYFL